MTLKDVYNHLAQRLPIEQIPLTWEAMGYTSEAFNRWVSDPDFSGWTGDLPTAEEARVIVNLLKTQPGNSLLDVACGYGRHALLLAADYGLRITGVDVSPGLISTARRLAEEQDLDIVYEVRHAADLTWENEFDSAMIAYNSFSLFAPEVASVVLQSIHRALRPGGRLFLDLDNKPFNCRYGRFDTNWATWPGGLTLGEVCFHEDSSVEVCRDLIFRTDAEAAEAFIIFKRIYSQDEIVDLLSSCGFQVEQIYGGWDSSPLTDHSAKMLLVGMKQ
ncbi:MAG: methyltransferase domain-containing protein [Candidatus Poribacteria bacterium]|nr:methyltransferase domain-containing protein [Candidatus Poribacteria bacterium]